MAIEEVAPFWRDLGTFLRRTLSGYVYITLTAPLWLKASAIVLDFGMVLALLIIAGTIIGSIIYDAWSFLYWYLAWHNESCRRLWGLDHVKTLRDRLLDDDDRYRRAFWDEAFFTTKDEVQKRILNMFSGAHGSATSAIALLLAILTWFCFPSALCATDFFHSVFPSSCVSWLARASLLVVAAVFFILLVCNHYRLCREAGALENLFLETLWFRVEATSRINRPHRLTIRTYRNL